ncbi:Alpha/Beta hydrolase protein [Corynascus novoguineensis]|uniref:Alpha/Beta hydrolase protein n=1 Tax=Corynascus novoguineensis TaxID=1126955 RepID=A0AAN7CMH3_9PEZI|nr:Alpha/Beta hydrolase protein [Corynascus novoguineensis]
MSTIPKTPEEILATSVMDPEFEAAWKARGSPSGTMPTDVATLKRMVDDSLPGLQCCLVASRPSDITETEHAVPLSTGFSSRVLVVSHTTITTHQQKPPPSPVIILFHGGIHVLGHPEFDVPLARQLALTHNVTVILPSTRKAPKHPFPATIEDAWALLQTIARDATTTSPERTILPPNADPAAGFIVGGTSAGANVADVVAHLARDTNLTPLLTGAFLACGAFIDPGHVPQRYRAHYLSREQNRSAPVADEDFMRAFREAAVARADATSPLWAPFVQQPNRLDDDGIIAAGHKGMPRTYFQVCGMDVNRDDGLIYERVLREECGLPTRLDLYSGFPHCWWDMYPELEASKKRMEHTMAGFAWLLSGE